MTAQGTNNSLGGSEDTGYVRHDLSKSANEASFLPDPNPQTIGGQALSGITKSFDTAATKTPLTTLTGGTNFLNSAALKVNVGALASGANASANISSAGMTAAATQNLQAERGAFEATLAETQATVMQAMDQSVDALGLDPSEAGKSFQPAPMRSDAGAAMAVAGGLAGGAALGGVSVIYDLKRMAGDNLSPQDEVKLAEMIQQSLLPTRDANGEMIEEARIPNNFDEGMLAKAAPQELVELFKEVLKPPSEQPEGIAFAAMEAKLNDTLDVHVENQNTNESTIAIAEEIGVDVADVSINDGGLTYETFDGVGSGGVDYLEFPPVANADTYAVPLELVAAPVKPLPTPEIAYKPPPMEMTPDGATQAA